MNLLRIASYHTKYDDATSRCASSAVIGRRRHDETRRIFHDAKRKNASPHFCDSFPSEKGGDSKEYFLQCNPVCSVENKFYALTGLAKGIHFVVKI